MNIYVLEYVVVVKITILRAFSYCFVLYFATNLFISCNRKIFVSALIIRLTWRVLSSRTVCVC